jgi:hypothetical protein
MELKHKSIEKVKNRYEPLNKSTMTSRPNEEETSKNK